VIEIYEYINVKKRAEELECNIPTEVTVLPVNFETVKSKTEFKYEFMSMYVTKVMRNNEINETPLEKEGESRNTITQFSLESNLPTLFFAAKFIAMVGCTILLNLISSYIHDKRSKKKTKSEDVMELNIVTETKSGSYKRIHYKGSDEHLEEIKKIIRSVYNE